MKPTVIVLGEEARRDLGLKDCVLHPQMRGRVAYRYVPSEQYLPSLLELIMELFP